MTACPTCGSPVRVVSADEGTQSYAPIPGEPQTDPRPSEAMQGAVGALANMHDFVKNGHETLNAGQVENLKAMLALDIGLIGRALADLLTEARTTLEAEQPEPSGSSSPPPTLDVEHRHQSFTARDACGHCGPIVRYARRAAEEAGT